MFDEREDPRELINRAGDEAIGPVLKRLRDHLDRLRANPGGAARGLEVCQRRAARVW
jgi:hypothetical protein